MPVSTIGNGLSPDVYTVGRIRFVPIKHLDLIALATAESKQCRGSCSKVMLISPRVKVRTSPGFTDLDSEIALKKTGWVDKSTSSREASILKRVVQLTKVEDLSPIGCSSGFYADHSSAKPGSFRPP
jgi:hypothetical protein